MVFLKVVLVGLASPRGLTVQCFPQEYFSPTPPFHFTRASFAECPRAEPTQLSQLISTRIS